MNYPFGKILSFSPERFLSINQGIVETKPIKGTRRRSSNPVVDKKILMSLGCQKKTKLKIL
jgi:para-aminobenzoate synthetase component 1